MKAEAEWRFRAGETGALAHDPATPHAHARAYAAAFMAMDVDAIAALAGERLCRYADLGRFRVVRFAWEIAQAVSDAIIRVRSSCVLRLDEGGWWFIAILEHAAPRGPVAAP